MRLQPQIMSVTLITLASMAPLIQREGLCASGPSIAPAVYSNALENPESRLTQIFPDFKAFSARSISGTMIYEVKGSSSTLGYVVGSAEHHAKGTFMQIFVAFEPYGAIRDVYVQRLNGGIDAPLDAFRTAIYRRQFKLFDLTTPPEDAYAAPPHVMESWPEVRVHQWIIQSSRNAMMLLKENGYFARGETSMGPAPR